MTTKNNLFKLSGKIQHYQWGGHHFLPDLLDMPHAHDKPFAEYWLGAHDNAPAEVMMGEEKVLLNEYINRHPDVLGDKVRRQFGRLPYLLKVLDVKDMLSIQVHPSKQAAEMEFERENKAGIPLNAPDRNYKDDNHKPELMVALGDFWLSHGFRSPEKINEAIDRIPEFAFMSSLFNDGGYKKLYSTLMEMEQAEVNRILQPLLERIVAAYECDYLSKDDPHFWAARAAYTFNEPGKIDRGIFSIYLLNLVHLKAGEAIFQDAGVLHAYLEGQNIEIMANSDNVLRGGLTPKHIDVPELMKHVIFEPVVPQIIQGGASVKGEEVFLSPAPDFRLSRFVGDKGETVAINVHTTDIFLLMEGAVELTEPGGNSVLLKQGEAVIALAGAQIEAKTDDHYVFYRATVNI